MPKLETIATQSYGDGRPWDVAVDRKLANNFNTLSDGKLLHQTPMVLASAETSFSSLLGYDDTVWQALLLIPVMYGTEHLGTGVSRTLTGSLWFASSDGGSAWLRTTLVNRIPTIAVAVAEGAPTGGEYGDAVFPGDFSRGTTFTTTSTTWQQTAEFELNLGAGKDIFFGIAYLVVEGAGSAACRGLAKLQEGPRVVV